VLVDAALAQRPVYGVIQIREIGQAVDQVQQLTGARATRLPGGIVVLT
jgi:transmembrane sensor